MYILNFKYHYQILYLFYIRSYLFNFIFISMLILFQKNSILFYSQYHSGYQYSQILKNIPIFPTTSYLDYSQYYYKLSYHFIWTKIFFPGNCLQNFQKLKVLIMIQTFWIFFLSILIENDCIRDSFDYYYIQYSLVSNS